jgi:hypothetical protein
MSAKAGWAALVAGLNAPRYTDLENAPGGAEVERQLTRNDRVVEAR